ncbi:methyltransferase domain-containing protein [Candidatus Woesearchaeota archaeon]|jgi:tRNA (guanine10-N2)-dimethyltransferase|nr:methyltransferase domain-containing protein [Candidatus Woesearchaeota archaeon]MBT3538064.1 methyltransferase domain-containing protein [Candidatus Woesearchaeota archaeon]MBT4697148.1 methyltransferase domain-containing protein [Candidatus Woesearchaeota archaeon]MBT4717139.1 methyltransferase domain-containing protein [Candidatus Woesearchaeota archaeon]MBT7105733.1 methyltransferase domain-containing protein [Candidatus Woesearchaeota archaeon]
MKWLFVLDKEDIKLARAEVEALCGKGRLRDNILIVEGQKSNVERLSYCHKVLRFVCCCRNVEWIGRINWNEYYRKNFCVRVSGFKGERRIASLIFKNLEKSGIKPKVNLRSPEMLVEVYKIKDKYYVGIVETEVDKSFLKRRAHQRPGLHPTATSPKLTRAGINLTEIKKGESILDPFCGSGTTLIESSLMGVKATGYDVDERLIKKCKANLKHYNLKAKVKLSDATKLNEKFDYVFTDLPYARGTKSIDLDETYSKFMNLSYRYVRTSMVVVFPDFVDYRKYLGRWKVGKKFSQYVHKSLSKNILVLVK